MLNSMNNRTLAQVESDLFQWGEYMRRYGDNLGYSKPHFNSGSSSGDKTEVPVIITIDEDYILKIDRLIASFAKSPSAVIKGERKETPDEQRKRLDGLLYKTAAKGYYIHRMSKKKLSKSLRISAAHLERVLDSVKVLIVYGRLISNKE